MNDTRHGRRRTFWLGFAAGVAAMFVFDPSADAGRRSQMLSQLRALLVRTGRRSARLLRYVRSESEGAGLRLVHRHPGPPVDDQALLDRIQSEIYRDPSVPKGAFDLEVLNGEAVLRGQLPDLAAIEVVVGSVRAVDGVRSVRSLLHVAGTPAPNKVDALQVSPTAAR